MPILIRCRGYLLIKLKVNWPSGRFPQYSLKNVMLKQDTKVTPLTKNAASPEMLWIMKVDSCKPEVKMKIQATWCSISLKNAKPVTYVQNNFYLGCVQCSEGDCQCPLYNNYSAPSEISKKMFCTSVLETIIRICEHVFNIHQYKTIKYL